MLNAIKAWFSGVSIKCCRTCWEGNLCSKHMPKAEKLYPATDDTFQQIADAVAPFTSVIELNNTPKEETMTNYWPTNSNLPEGACGWQMGGSDYDDLEIWDEDDVQDLCVCGALRFDPNVTCWNCGEKGDDKSDYNFYGEIPTPEVIEVGSCAWCDRNNVMTKRLYDGFGDWVMSRCVDADECFKVEMDGEEPF